MRLRYLLILALGGAFTLCVAGCSQCSPPSPEKEKEQVGAKEGTAAEKAQQAAPVEEETGPIATINGEEVPRAEFDDMYEKMIQVYIRRNKPVPENVARRHKQNIVNRLIEKKLLEQAIAKNGVKVTDEELNEGLAKYKEMFRTEANFERYLASSNTTLDKIKENISFNKALDKLLEKDGPVAVTDEQMKEYYEQNKSRYEVKEMVKAGHILIRLKKDATEAEKTEALEKAKKIHAEAKKPKADFQQLAIKHSEGPTGPKGGDLGFFTRGRMAPEFEEVAFNMKPNEVSKPVLTQFGYHIIKLYEKKPAGQKSFDEVKESISKLLESRDKRKRKSDLLRELKKTATIVNNLKLPPATGGLDTEEGGAAQGIKLIPSSPGAPVMVQPPEPVAVPPTGSAGDVPAAATPAPAPAPAE
ncbi:MAG: hypothetical protein FJ125_07665 [Deltaproteobacteria bacterium]|nr:hypothetical protein [Deltaproteobacteria bacterium]